MNLTNVRNLFVGFALLGASIYYGPSVRAATYTWTPAVAGTYDWNTTTQDNWGTGVAGGFPNAIDDVANMDTLDLTGTQSINLGGQSITLGELHLGDTGGGSGLSFAQHIPAAAGNALVFQKSSGNAKLSYGNPSVNLRTSLNIDVPVTLNSDTEITVALQSSTSRNLYFRTGALTGSGNMILGAPTRGIVAFFTDAYDFSAYTGTIKFTEYSAAGSGNGLQFAGNNLGTGNFHQATLEMTDLTGGTGHGVFIFDAQDGATMELGALRGNGLLRPFTNFNVVYLSGTLKTGYLPGTNDYSGVISPLARFPNDSTPVTFNYEKVGTSSTQIFSGANTYTGTTTVSEGTLLVNGTHIGGSSYSVASGATLGGTGSIDISGVTVDAGGILAPGASIESLDVGSATINGTLAIQYQGSTIDLLNVTNSVLDITNATVEFSNLGGALTAGPHVFATYLPGLLSGTMFSSTIGLPSGASIDYNYLGGNQIALIAPVPPPVPGDYNNNGAVDAADYVLWRKGGPLQNEVDAPGTVNGVDYTAWRARFGNTSGSGSGLGGAGAIPEPTGFLLLATAILGAIASRWRR